ncbi:MAG: dTDP-glucose 4,6-dehydratase [Armatimonadetes bacterium]|nr:dTDP-glucose 4,6-dehydratase [Armatimonadota bacterium]
MNVLVTGAAGFIGSHFVRRLLASNPSARISVLDALTYAGNLSTMEDFLPNVQFFPGRIQDRTVVEGIIRSQNISHIVNFAAETHNDRSMLDATSFIETNTIGVQVLLEATRTFGLTRMIHISTDEVYGSTADGVFTEQSPLEPNTPYSSSKAGGDLLCRAHHKAYKTPVIVTRGGNNYGPYQFPEKLIPFFTIRLLQAKKVPLYGEGNQSREWIHVADHCSAIELVLNNGTDGEIYNIGTHDEATNRSVVDTLLRETGRDDDSVRKIPDPRQGAHDFRYSMKTDKIRSLGWAPEHSLEVDLPKTIQWYRHNVNWWKPVVDRTDTVEFVKRYYGPGLGEDL